MSKDLNSEQQLAADAFFDFLLNDKKEMIISGPGGVGKTYLMGHMIDVVLPKYFNTCKLLGIPVEYNDVAMTATTNKAAEELGRATGRPCSTIHAYMNLRVTDDYSTGKSNVQKTRSWVVHNNKIIFVDECSMIDTTLRNYLLEGTCNCKIVYVGDQCQLAPVKEPISPIYTLNLPEYELVTPMRTKCPHLQNLNHTLRERVKAKEFGPIQLVPGIIDWLSQEEATDVIDDHFITKDNEDRIMGFTNSFVMDANSYIRDMRQLPKLLTVGEHLISNSACNAGMARRGFSVEQGIKVIKAATTTTTQDFEGKFQFETQKVDLADNYGTVYLGVEVFADRNHYLDLIKWAAANKDWPAYFYLKNNYPDLRERDVCTVYKSQGSTYNTAFIDLSNISQCKRPDVAMRLLYVACSRARERVVFFGDLAPRFGKLIN